jgi:integrase
LNTEARQLLENHPKTSKYVFPGRNGGRRVDVHKEVRAIADKAGLPKNFRPLHGIRHSFASAIASSGKVDIYTLSKLMGHADTRMTMRYAHLRDQALKNASQVAAELFKTGEKEDNKVIELKK